MTKVIRRIFYNVKRSDQFHIVPIGDVHIGNAGCDEDLLRSVVEHVRTTPDCFWCGLGDFCDFVNVRDPRFEADQLASWVETENMVDLARVQVDRFIDIISPIADRCFCILEGNHERAIRQHTERDIYREIIARIKGAAGFDSSIRLGLGFAGWLQLLFRRSGEDERAAGTVTVNVYLHHGFVGGKLAGAKALNMQRALWSRAADLTIWGHSHTPLIQPESVEYLDSGGNIKTQLRRGAIAGSFLRGSPRDKQPGYAERRGYFPAAIGGTYITMWPQNKSGVKMRLSFEG